MVDAIAELSRSMYIWRRWTRWIRNRWWTIWYGCSQFCPSCSRRWRNKSPHLRSPKWRPRAPWTTSPLLPESCVYYLFDHLLHDARDAVGFVLKSFMVKILDHNPGAHHPDWISCNIAEPSCYRCGCQVLLPFWPVFGTAPWFHALVDWEK